MQVDPIKATLKASRNKRSKQKYDEPLSQFAFKFNLRRYNKVQTREEAEMAAGAYTRPLFGSTSAHSVGQGCI